MTNRNFLLFRNALFLSYQSDEDNGRWFVGGDCLGWIYARLLPRPDLRDVCCPVMEDWGWYASVETRYTKVRVELLLLLTVFYVTMSILSRTVGILMTGSIKHH